MGLVVLRGDKRKVAFSDLPEGTLFVTGFREKGDIIYVKVRKDIFFTEGGAAVFAVGLNGSYMWTEEPSQFEVINVGEKLEVV